MIVFQLVRSVDSPAGNVGNVTNCGRLRPDSRFPVVAVGAAGDVTVVARFCRKVGA